MKKALLGGGTGFVGTAVKQALQGEGFAVTIISRTPSNKQEISWDDIAKLGIPDGTTHIINTAGENVLNPLRLWTKDFKENVIASRVYSNKLLAYAMDNLAKKPKVFVTMSGIGIYKPDQQKVYNENSEVAAHDFLSSLVEQWEEATKNMSGVRRVAIRSGVILGNSGGMVKQIYWPFYLGLGGPLGSGEQYFPWIHIDDLVEVILLSLSNEKVEGVLNAVAPQIITNKQFSDVFAKALGKSAKFPTPSSVIKLLFGKDRAVMMLEGQKVAPSRLLNELNYVFSFPDIESAINEIVGR